MKKFYSVPDTAFVKIVPQPVQHLSIASMAKSLEGEVVFYTMEGRYSLTTHEVIRKKLAERPPIDGVIFFRLGQFMAEGLSQAAILRSILEAGYSVHFARERISIASEADLARYFPMMYAYRALEARDTSPGAFTKQLLDCGMLGSP